jgi:hypothetical protein
MFRLFFIIFSYKCSCSMIILVYITCLYIVGVFGELPFLYNLQLHCCHIVVPQGDFICLPHWKVHACTISWLLFCHLFFSLGPLVNKVKDVQVETIVDTLCNNMLSEKEQLRDISSIGLFSVE